MKELFFMIGVFFAIQKIGVFLNSRKNVEIHQKAKKMEYWQNSKSGPGFFMFVIDIIYLIWLIIGMSLSHLWILFTVLFVVEVFQFFFEKYYVKKISSLISVILLLFVFFVHFHFYI